MIHAESVKAAQELLIERGIEPRQNERWGDFVARGLDISSTQAEAFLYALDQNKTIDEARAAAGIPAGKTSDGLLTDIARAIGRALGDLNSHPSS